MLTGIRSEINDALCRRFSFLCRGRIPCTKEKIVQGIFCLPERESSSSQIELKDD